MENNRMKIIMVDDDIANLHIGKKTLIDKYDIFTIPSGEKLFALLKKVMPDLILLDVEMPVMNGYEVIKKLKSRSDTAHIPVILLTAANDNENEIAELAPDAIDYITKPLSPPLLLKRIDIHMLIESQKKQLNHYKEKSKTVFNLQNAILKTVADLVECRDDITGGHIERTQNYLKILLDALIEDGLYNAEIATWDVDSFVLSAQLHDVGKIAIKDTILLKPFSLTEDEFNEIKAHTIFGVKVIQKIEKSAGESTFLKYAEILAASHHERWDGTGYPLRLSMDTIPLEGRIMAIVDVYDALTNERPYRNKVSHEEAIEIIKNESGKHFDPRLVDVFLKNEEKFKDDICTGISMIQEKKDICSELNDTVSKVISEIVDYRNGADEGNIVRIQGYLKILLDAMQNHESYNKIVSEWDIDLFILSAQLYDIGKISIKDNILQKPTKLTNEEYTEMKTHTELGIKAIQKMSEDSIESLFLEYAENLTGKHHEKWDGTGYPSGLSGENIPLQGRIMAIVDVYDALINSRHYKKALSHEEAVDIIKKGSGTQFDPALVKLFLENEKKLIAFRDSLK